MKTGDEVYFTGWLYESPCPDEMPMPDGKFVQNEPVVIISIDHGTCDKITIELKSNRDIAFDCVRDSIHPVPYKYDEVLVICPNCNKAFDCGDGTANFWWGGIHHDEENIRCPHCQASTETKDFDSGAKWTFDQFILKEHKE